MLDAVPTGGVEVGVLGPLRVTVDGAEVNPGGPVPRSLVARLVLAGGATVTDSAIVDDLWGEDPPPSASAALQAYISRLRRVLEPHRAAGGAATVLLRRGPGYALALTDDAVDAERFERLAAQARPLVESDPRAAVALLDEALGLWRGPAYADVAEREFARPEAFRLEELRTSAVEHRLTALLHGGELAEAVTGLEAFVAVPPLRERAWELLALALYRQHRQADALEALARLRAVLADELGSDPGPAATALQAALLAQDPALLAVPTVRQAPAPQPLERTSNLPARLSSLVGRAGEVTEISELLRQHRLVTLLGTGGAGKTRLSLEVARACAEVDADGPWLIELAGVRDGSLLVQAVGSTIGLAATGGAAALAGVLGSRELVLVLDNCEHLLDAVADLVTELLGACPNLRVLASSREPLGVEGEVGYDVPPLSAGAGGEAVALFLDRAGAAAPGWDPDAADLVLVERICADLDGLPLAVELAAAQLRALSLEQVESMLDDRFALLRGGRRTNSRHATMLAAVQWSYDVLDDDERAVFCDLSVFDGGFTLGAARRVLDRPDAVVVVADLVAKSLVVASPTGTGGRPGRRRYRLLETLRQFAASRLAPDRAAQLRERHGAWVVDLAATADSVLRGRVSLAATSELHEESANIRAAIAVAGPADVLRIAAGFYWFWYREGLVAEGLGLLLPALAAVSGDPDGPPDHSTRARAALGAALLSYLAGDLTSVGANLQLAGQEAAVSGDPTAQAQVLGTLAYFEARSGQLDAASEHAGVAAHLVAATGQATTRAELFMVEGEIARQRGSHDDAVRHLQRAVADAEAEGYAWVAISSRWIQAKTEVDRERWDAAHAAALDSLQRSATANETTSWLVALATLSHVLHRVGDGETAAELAGAVAWIGGRIGFSPSMMDPDLERYAAELAADLPPEVFAAAADRGRASTPSEVTERLLSAVPAAPARS